MIGKSKTNCNIWFTSDTHYNHKNICRGISDWANKETTTRDFLTLEKMNSAIVDSINSLVGPDDILYHLGDWSFGGIESIWKFRQRIYCQNIHLITGNHDQHIKKNKVLPNCIQVYHGEFEYSYINGLQDELSFTRIQAEAQKLFASTQGYLELKIGKQIFILSHYPIDEWFEMDRKGAIMLHGHVHHTMDKCELNTKYRRMDVGIDWKEFRPYSLEEIVRIMSKRERKQHSS
jgi:calcineurin-like phosphoesterase family protein